MIVGWIDLALLAQDAGFKPGSELVTAISIVEAESHRDAAAISPVNDDGSVDRGLWQINSNHLPDGAYKTLVGYTADDLFDPVKNARAAYIIYSRRGSFSAWATFNDGLDIQYRSIAIVANAARDRIRKLESQLASCKAERDRISTDLDACQDRVLSLNSMLSEVNALVSTLLTKIAKAKEDLA